MDSGARTITDLDSGSCSNVYSTSTHVDQQQSTVQFTSMLNSAIHKIVLMDSSPTTAIASQGCSNSEESVARVTVSRTPRQISSPLEPMLPPCRICSEKASGFHYGANTCEACKAFFRRSLRNKVVYKCNADGNCPIMPGKRNSCPACRLQKCINIGMSKTAIKTGRYTHAKKAKDITEVKMLRQQAAQQQQQDVDVGEESRESFNTVESMSDCAASLPSSPLLPRVVSRFTPGKVENLEKVIDHITRVHHRVTVLTPEFLNKLPIMKKQYLEQRALQQEIFGPMQPVTDADYIRIYRATGIDIDDRREILQNDILAQIETCVKRIVTFVKAIPGFTRLPMDDQIALVKASRFDVCMIMAQPCFDTVNNIMFTVTGQPLSLEDLSNFNKGCYYFEPLFEFQTQLQKLHLNDEENCILSALCVMATDRCKLEDVKAAEWCQCLMVDCLLYLVDKYHAGDSIFLARLTALLVQLRNLHEKWSRIEEDLVEQWCDMIEFPPLFFEMFSSM